VKSWFERDPDRYQRERSYWISNGFTESGRSSGELSYTGTTTVRVGGPDGLTRSEFKLRVDYPRGFPYVGPTVEFLEPPIRRSRHQSPDGEPCLFPARDWTESVEASDLRKAIDRWLRGYIMGSFPRELALYELPEYFPPSALTVLTAEQFFDAIAGQERGRFSVLVADGPELGVLATVDGNRVGAELVEGLRLGALPTKPKNGSWHRVEHEPPISLRTTSELQAYLADEGQTLSVPRAPQKHGLVGLVFTDSVLEQERLLLFDYSSTGKGQRPARGWSLRAPATYVVSRTELFRRLEGVRETETLAKQRLLLLGAGAIGSTLGETLTREGLGAFSLCDPDRLRPGNVARNALDLFASGQNKAVALEAALSQIDPYLETSVETSGATLRDPGALANLMSTDHPLLAIDLAVVAIGEDVTETLICQAAAANDAPNAPLLFVRTVHHGVVTRLMLWRPGRGDACVECLRLHQEDDHEALISVPDPEPRPVYDEGCATPAEPGAGIAMQQAAVLAAKRALEVLEGRDGDANHWVWIDRAVPEAEDNRLHEADRLYSMRLDRHPECGVCDV
jgi:ThiF family